MIFFDSIEYWTRLAENKTSDRLNLGFGIILVMAHSDIA